MTIFFTFLNFMIWSNKILIFILFIVSLIIFFKFRKKLNILNQERNTLLQEKEATIGFVQNVGEVFADSENIEMDILLERVLHYAVRTCKAGSGAIYLIDGENNLIARSISGVFPPLFEINEDLLKTSQNISEDLKKIVYEKKLSSSNPLISESVIQGKSLLIEDAEMDVRVPQLSIEFLRIRSLLIIPMRFGNDVIGVMTLANKTGHTRFALSDLNLAQALAGQASVPIHYADLQEALEQKRQLDRDMQIARQIQNSLLPQSLPEIPQIDIAAFSHPALDIGGDYYDVIEIDNKHIGMVIADVSGKGIGGALMMAVCRSVIQTQAKNEYDPSSMLVSLNEILSTNLAENMFVSMLYMVLNIETHLLSYARAGHEAPIIFHRDTQKIDREEIDGIAIGLVDKPTFTSIIETKNIQLRSGDLVVTYTDGITEAMNDKGEEWGIEKLLKYIKQNNNNSATQLLEGIENNVLQFAGNTPQYDDMTMLAINII